MMLRFTYSEFLAEQGTRSSAAVAQAAVDAAKSQHTTVPAQHLGEVIVVALAREIITLDQELAELDALISEKVIEHRHAQVLLSMPGFGPVLAAEFLGTTGGDLTVFETADRFAGVAGLAPVPWDSGRITGNHHRPPPALRPQAPARLLPVRAYSPEKLPRFPDLLRPQTRRRENPHPGHAFPGPAPHERPLGHAPRRHPLRPGAGSPPGCLSGVRPACAVL